MPLIALKALQQQQSQLVTVTYGTNLNCKYVGLPVKVVHVLAILYYWDYFQAFRYHAVHNDVFVSMFEGDFSQVCTSQIQGFRHEIYFISLWLCDILLWENVLMSPSSLDGWSHHITHVYLELSPMPTRLCHDDHYLRFFAINLSHFINCVLLSNRSYL